MADHNHREIDADTFGAYADRKGIHIKICPSCGIDDPSLLVHDNGETSVALTYARGWESFPSALPLVAIECSNCGYLWLYNRLNVIKKMESGE